MKKLILFILISFSGFHLKSQTNLDSLFNIWQDKTKADSSRVTAFKLYIYKEFLFSNPDSAFNLAEEMLAYAQKKQYAKGMAIAYNIQGGSFYLRGSYPKALGYSTQSLNIFEEIADKKGIASLLNNIGNIYFAQGNYPKTLDYFTRSLKIYKEIGRKNGMATSLNNIGGIYDTRGNYPKALDYHTRSLKIRKEIGNKDGIAESLINIGLIYQNQDNYSKALNYYQRSLKIYKEIGKKNGIANSLISIGIIYQLQGNYPKALDYNTRSLKINEENGDKNRIANSLSYIGGVYNSQGNYLKALNYNSRSLKIQEEIGDKAGVANSLNNIGDIYNAQGKHVKAIKQCQQSLILSKELRTKDNQKDACYCLYEANKAIGNTKSALMYYEQMQLLDDSLNSEETGKKLHQMEFAKQAFTDSIATAEKERIVEEVHLEEVRQKNKIRNMLAGGGLVLLLIAGGFYSRLRYTRKSKAILQIEKDRSENLLLNILPADIAAELKEKGKAKARDFDMVSILFTDFKGFTSVSEKLSAQELVAEINSCFEAFDGIMDKYNIEKIKTIGDAYMAAGGLPVPDDDSVKNTVLAALDMQSFISKRKKDMDAKRKPSFEMRVGIHTGPIVAGIVGVKKFAYDIWGDTVNTASRMESSGSVEQVNISQATYELLKDDEEFSFENRGKIEAKGKGEIEMYFVNLKTEAV